MRWINADQRARRTLRRWEAFDKRDRLRTDVSGSATRRAFAQFEIEQELDRLKRRIGTPVGTLR